MKPFLAMLSVPTHRGHITAIVPVRGWYSAKGEALRRLMADDSVWCRDDVRLHWIHPVYPSKTRVAPRDSVNFKFVAAA